MTRENQRLRRDPVAVTLAISLWVCGPGALGATKPPAEISGTTAVNRALLITGLGGAQGLETVAQREALAKADDVPYLRIAGRRVWRITFHNVHLTVRGPANSREYQKPWDREDGGTVYENASIHDLAVLLDAKNGALVKIISPLPEGIPPGSQATLAEREKRHGYETYASLPKDLPHVTFVEALQSAQEGLGGVPEARQIEAVYVLYKRTPPKKIAPGFLHCRDDGPCPRWFVTLRYLPPLVLRPGKEKPKPFEHYEHEIDAFSGEWLQAGNVP